MPNSIAPTEILWTLWGVLGMIYVGRNYKITVQVSKAVRQFYHDDPHLVEYLAASERDVRHEILRLVKLAVVAVSGVVAMVTPPANPDIPVTPVQVIIVLSLFVIVSIVVLQSYLDARYRNSIEEIRRNGNNNN